MDMNGYQQEAKRTWGAESGRETMLNGALGLAGESGEVVDLIKEVAFHGRPLDTIKITKELGDALYYVAVLADCFGLTLEQVAEANVAKLRARYPDGFSVERSKNRTDG